MFLAPVQKLRELGAAALLSISSVFELQKVMDWILKKGKCSGWSAPNFLDTTLTLIQFANELCLLQHLSLLQLCQSIVNDLIKQRPLSDLPDLCRASLLSLLAQIGAIETQQAVLSQLQQDVCDLHSITWSNSIRPIATLLANPKVSGLNSRKSYVVVLVAREVDQVKSYLGAEKIELLNQFIEQQLLNALFIRSIFIRLQLRKTVFHLNNCICSENCVRFLKACLQDPYDDIRLETLKIVKQVVKATKNEILLKLGVLRLKDEEGYIRKYASTELTPFFWEGGVLTDINSEIAWSLALEKWPDWQKKCRKKSATKM
uniref:Uncharacterized protein n=1 Tax=Ditylenchus dipsaci TaxID=166011 RepID=A0A915ELF9_9BILA